MLIVWDEIKRQTNLQKRRLDFADLENGFDWDDIIYLPAHPGTDGRKRVQVVGRLGEKLVAVVYSALGSEAISIISVRPASIKERRQFNER